jgi:hypothetical protein
VDADNEEEEISLRCQNAIDCVTKGRISPAELFEYLQMPDPRFRHFAEDVGLGRLFRGYENVEYNELVGLLNVFTSTAQRIGFLLLLELNRQRF